MNTIIKNKCPNLSESSIITYSSILRNLYKKIFGDEEIDFDKFEDTKTILGYLSDIEPSKRKTLLSALYAITSNDKYRKNMMKDIKVYEKDISKQEKTKTQSDNWLSETDIQETLNKYEADSKLIYKKKIHNKNDLQDIQNYIILCLLSGRYIAPRRNLDYVNFKIKNIDKDEDNYIDGSSFKFNSYKTKKTYGTQTVKIPVKLKNILTKWIAINPTDYLLFDSSENKLSSVKLNQRLNKFFGRKAGVNALRHSYLTTHFGSVDKDIDDVKKTMSAMGSSLNMLKNYVKH